jgi:3-isopropylmalate/(R)-2-methylmalate dehydratase large subunit
MQPRTLYDKLWDTHVVHVEPDGTALIYIDRQLVHEVTSPQAFEGLKINGRKPWRLASLLATPDHNIPTTDRDKGIADPFPAPRWRPWTPIAPSSASPSSA